jgi:hypothetical protein
MARQDFFDNALTFFGDEYLISVDGWQQVRVVS